LLYLRSNGVNQVVWAPVARSSFQGRTRGIPGSIPRGNNAWPIRMSRISRPPLVGRKPVRKPHKKDQIEYFANLKNYFDQLLIKIK